MELLQLIHKVICIHIRKHRKVQLFCALFALCVLIPVASCTDDLLPSDTPTQSDLGEGLVEVDLQGFIGINIAQLGQFSTRADENTTSPSDYPNSKFDDGLPDEYAFASGSDHHFLLIYKGDYNTETASKPLAVFPMSIADKDSDVESKDEKDREGNIINYDNITLVAKSLVTTSDMLAADGVDLSSPQKIASIFNGNLIVALMNFDKDLIDYTTLSTTIGDKSSTKGVLAQITKNDLLNNLCVKDWKISVTENGVKTDYLTMTNSVNPNDGLTALEYNYSVDSNYTQRIYTDTSQAIEHPIAGVYVERLAVKYTVSFTPPSAGEGDDVTGGDEIINDGTATPVDEDLFPSYLIKINKYGSSDGLYGVTFTKDGYEIHSSETTATVKILGYGVSNLEKTERLVKKIGFKNYYTNWNNAGSSTIDRNHRCYWAIDPHYDLSSGDLYPHQFRAALETDTIGSLFENNGNGYIYKERPYYDDVYTNVNGSNIRTRYYREIGSINMASKNVDCVLDYKSFEALNNHFKDTIYDKVKKEFRPFYSTENTYYDPGMKDGEGTYGTWNWEWRRAPYTTATNLIVLAQILPAGVSNDDKTVYRGQNNIFYYSLYGGKEEGDDSPGAGLINSKLYILNDIMLNGGNAGFQIFDGQWDSHAPGAHTTLLDKIAWNENSYVWLRYLDDPDNNPNDFKYRRMLASDFELIPAELAGGDGQCLIAPAESVMGKNFRYYLAPKKKVTDDETGNVTVTEEIDLELGVQISYNHLIGLIHKIIGPVDVFKDGYMYYSVPISHSETSFIESNSDTSKESWRSIGKVGVVRNNWYNITVSNITGVGTPVQDVTQPIVPVMEIRRSYINMGVKLMGWHTISQGGVPM